MNEMTVFQGKAPAAAFGAVQQADSLSDGIGGGYGVLHYTGKNWSLRLRGETYNFTRADDGTPLAYVDGIIIRQLPVKSRTYYQKGAYERGEVGPPLCSSIDGVRPDDNVKERQATACALCPRYEVKLNAEGRRGRECRDNKRLALLLTPALSKQILGAPLMEPVLLRVPAASLVALSNMGDDMARQGWGYFTFVTRIGFVADKPYPELTFKAIVALTDKEAPIVLSMREDQLAYRITGESELNKARPISSPQVAATIAQPAANLQIDTEPRTTPTQKPASPAPVQRPVMLELKANEPEDLGFGTVDEPAKVEPKVEPKVVSAAPAPAPVGETEDADDDLDARVAALLQTT